MVSCAAGPWSCDGLGAPQGCVAVLGVSQECAVFKCGAGQGGQAAGGQPCNNASHPHLRSARPAAPSAAHQRPGVSHQEHPGRGLHRCAHPQGRAADAVQDCGWAGGAAAVAGRAGGLLLADLSTEPSAAAGRNWAQLQAGCCCSASQVVSCASWHNTHSSHHLRSAADPWHRRRRQPHHGCGHA